MSDYGIPLFNQLYSNPQPYKPDVALVIDRNSILYQKVDMDMMGGQRGELRYALAKSGVAYGIYTLDDFLDGVLPPCKVYIFANTNYLTDAQIAQIQFRLNAESLDRYLAICAGISRAQRRRRHPRIQPHRYSTQPIGRIHDHQWVRSNGGLPLGSYLESTQPGQPSPFAALGCDRSDRGGPGYLPDGRFGFYSTEESWKFRIDFQRSVHLRRL